MILVLLKPCARIARLDRMGKDGIGWEGTGSRSEILDRMKALAKLSKITVVVKYHAKVYVKSNTTLTRLLDSR